MRRSTGDRQNAVGQCLLRGWRAGAGRAGCRTTPRPREPGGPDEARRSTSTASRCSTWAINFKQIHPNWFDACASPSCRRSRTQFGEDGSTFAGVRQSRLGVRVVHADARSATSRRPSSSSCSAPASTQGRRRSACGMPMASSGSSAPARPGARSWTSTSSRTRSSTGDRTAWCSSATCRSAGCRSATSDSRFDRRARAAGRQRRRRASTPTASSCRTSRAASRCPISPREYRYGAGVGLRRGRRASCARSSGTTRSTTQFDLSGERDRLGHQPQLERQVRQERRPAPAGRRTARASRTT